MSTMTRPVSSTLSEDGDLKGITDEEDRLYTAISFDKLNKVIALIPQLRNLEIRDSFCCTPLLHVARKARDDHVNFLVKLFIQHGSDVNAQDGAGMTALMHVIRRGNSVDALRTLLRCKNCDPDLRDNEGNTALMHAAMLGNAEALAILFKSSGQKHVEVNARNAEGLTALDQAVKAHQVQCCQILVEDGRADTNSLKDLELFNTLWHIGL